MSISKKERKLLGEVRDVMRLHHYSIYMERVYWGQGPYNNIPIINNTFSSEPSV